MSKRPTIRCLESREGRKEERRKLGKLTDQKVSPLTRQRYEEALQGLERFTRRSRAQLFHCVRDLNSTLQSYIEALWEDGEGRSTASYIMAAVQHHEPGFKRQLGEAWALVSLWNRLEQPRRATPLTPELTLAFAGRFLQWGWPDLADGIVVGFAGFLRTGELFRLRREHIVLPRRPSQAAVVFLEDTKTGQRRFEQWEKITLTEQGSIAALRRLCHKRHPNDHLLTPSAAKFRELWKEVVRSFHLHEHNFVPYSLRRGGATSAYREGMSFDQLLVHGRWRHIATARLYLDQGLQEYAALTLPMHSQAPLCAARRYYATTVSQPGTRGGARSR